MADCTCFQNVPDAGCARHGLRADLMTDVERDAGRFLNTFTPVAGVLTEWARRVQCVEDQYHRLRDIADRALAGQCVAWKERNEARREAEEMRKRWRASANIWPGYEFSWERKNMVGKSALLEGPTGCGDSPTADVPTGVESGPVGYTNRNGTSASEEPYNGARDGKMPRPGEPEHLRYLEALLAANNKWLKGLPVRAEFDHLNTECCSLVAGVDALSAKVDAVADLALALAETYTGPSKPWPSFAACIRDLAEKVRNR